jgi:hypothetical protein
MSLGNTKPFFERNLNEFNLLDFGQNLDEFDHIYDPDSRVTKYLEANLEASLPNGFVLAGHSEITRQSCGRFRGIKGTKKFTRDTLELTFDTCNKLTCPICVRKASKVKALKIQQKCKDYIWWLITHGYKAKYLCPKHISFDPIDFKPNFESRKAFHSSIKEFIDKNISPYLSGGVVFYHHHRFKNKEKRDILKVSPHFHVIGFGFLPNYKEYQEKHGFQYHSHGKLLSLADIFRVARYELTHITFPLDEIIRKTKRTDPELSLLVKKQEWDKFLNLQTKPIPEFKETKSLHSFHTYFYFNNMSPYKIRELKKKIHWLPERDDMYNKKVYEILDGIILAFPTKTNDFKFYNLQEAYDKALRITPDILVKVFKSKLRWGKLYKVKSIFRWLEIKNNVEIHAF